MNSWITAIRKVLGRPGEARGQTVAFAIIYAALMAVSLVISLVLTPAENKDLSLLLPLLCCAMVVCLLAFVNIIVYQRRYSARVFDSIEYEAIPRVILRTVAIYLIQFLIAILIAFVAAIVIAIPLALLKVPVMGLVAAIACLLIVGMIAWFYRLIFVPFILVYRRVGFRMSDAIRESSYLVRKRLGAVIVLIVLQIAILAPLFVVSYQGARNVPLTVSTSIVSAVYGFFMTVILLSFTVDAMVSDKYHFQVRVNCD
jgi:hypothetical protein